MGSPPGTQRGDWPWILKCVIWLLHQKQLSNSELLREFYKICPKHVLNEVLGYECTDNAVLQRRDKGKRPGYEHEHPDKRWSAAMPHAEKLVRAGGKLVLSSANSVRVMEAEAIGQLDLFSELSW